MSRIDALNLSFQPSFIQPTREIANINAAKETINFAQLLGSLTTFEGQAVSEETVSENPDAELLETLEEVVQSLQELPEEMLTVEEEEMVYGVLQLLAPQVSTEEIQLMKPNSSQEKPVASEEKLTSLLKKVSQELEMLLTPNMMEKPAVDAATKRLADPIKLEQVVQQLVVTLQSLGKEQRVMVDKPVMEQLLQKLSNNVGETKVPVQVTAAPLLNGQMTAAVRPVEVKLVAQQTEANASAGHSPSHSPSASPSPSDSPNASPSPSPSPSHSVTTQTEVSNQPQPLTVDVAQGSPKVIQATGRVETSEPTPTVRMSNLIEELGSVLRGSIRLTGTQEGTQIRVNITPDHLGHLDIRFTEINGKIAAQIFTSTLVAKEVLDLQMNQMRNVLLQQGIPLDKIEVSHQNLQSFGQQTDHRFSQQRREKQEAASHGKNEYERLDEEMAVEHNQSSHLSMNVNYTV